MKINIDIAIGAEDFINEIKDINNIKIISITKPIGPPSYEVIIEGQKEDLKDFMMNVYLEDQEYIDTYYPELN